MDRKSVGSTQVETPDTTEKEKEEIEDPEEMIMNSCPLFISFFTEFLGMAIQMFMGCLGSTYTFHIGPFLTMFSFGVARLAALEMFNHISPIHVNPAKSLGFLILGRMPVIRFLVYIVAQHLGATAGIAYVKAVTPSELHLICVVRLRGIGPAQGFVFELVTTLILMMVVAGITDPLNAHHRESFNLKMCMIVMGLILSIDRLTGAGKNPSRSFGPSFLYNSWGEFGVHWLYQVGPYLGAALGALLYRFVYDPHRKYSLHHLVRKYKLESRICRTR